MLKRYQSLNYLKRQSIVFGVLLLCMTVLHLRADTLPPYILNFDKSVYKAANQNWSITQASNRIMYFANTDGLLEYDGTSWNLMKMPDNTIVRSVYADSSGRIYVGSYQEFGYWQENDKGKFNYLSLSAQLQSHDFGNEEIWKINQIGETIYFQSFSTIYACKNDSIKIVNPPGTLLFTFKVGNKLWAQCLGLGLFELKNGHYQLVKGSEKFANTSILAIVPFGDGELLLGTATQGLFSYDGNQFFPVNSELSTFLKKYQLNNARKIAGGYAFGTIQNGLVITDESGNIIMHLNRENGLQNNTVLGIYEDADKNLWLGLDNGIDFVQLNEPFSYYRDQSGLLGSVYDAAFYNGKLYMGTNHGVFYKNGITTSGDFAFLSGSHGQVWNLDIIDGQLLCGHNEGTFTITASNTFEQISTITGGWIQRKFPSNPDLMIQGTYTGLALYENLNGQWRFKKRIAGFGHPVRYLEFDLHGDLWVSRSYRGLYRLRLNPSADSVVQSEYFGSKSGFPSDFNINVFRINKRVVFATGQKIFTFNDVQGKIVPFDRLNQNLGTLQKAHRILPAFNNYYWFVTNREIGLVKVMDNEVKQLHTRPFSRFISQMVSNYQNIVKLSDEKFLFCLDDGFALVDAQSILSADRQKNAHSLFIRKVVNLSDSNRFLAFLGGKMPEIKHNRSNLRIVYTSPVYGHGESRFQIMLEGFDKAWSEPTTQNYKEYSNLPAGTYTFHVRLLTERRGSLTEKSFRFRVLPPWYASWWAFLIYVLMAGAVILLFRWRYHQKLTRRHRKAIDLLHHEKEEQLKEERLLNEQRLIQLENDKLQSEIAFKSNELANSTMAIIKKNELLIRVKDELTKVKKNKDIDVPYTELNRLTRVVESNINNEDDWRIFEQSFNRAHEDFFKLLKKRYSELTPNDLRMCAYLKMNISSKEIAPLLNISVRGVEIRRYRLRKKLNLEHDDNLVEFMMAL